jgi:CSLREA domain-containing protein
MNYRNLLHYHFRGSMKTISTKLFYAFISVCLMVVLTGVKPAHADAVNLTVTKTTDTDDGACDVDCSLREAIIEANNNGPSADIIQFASNYTITLGSQLPAITTPITIIGNGAANMIIQANANPNIVNYRVFEVGNAGDLTLDSLTVQNGRCNGSCATETHHGGGIYNAGTLTVTNSVISNNYGTYGAGIFSINTLNVMASTFLDNTSNGNGGGIANGGIMNVTNSTFSSNLTTGGIGAGIFNGGGSTLTVTNSTFINNSANSGTFGGSGIFNQGTLHLKNNILANSVMGVDCYNANGDTIATNINNLIETNGPAGNMCGTPMLTSDPNLGSLTGSPGYFPLNPGSPAMDAGDDGVCAADPVNNNSQNDVTRPNGAHCDIGSFETLATFTTTLKSVNTNDGWILESTETSGNGGMLDSTAINFNLGDDAANKQYRAILHFDTSGLPDNAVITSATLKVKQQGFIGTDPFTLLGDLKASVRTPAFGTDTLALSDFKSAPGKNNVATFSNTPVSSWYNALINSTGRAYINRTDTTQFRLAFTTDDDNDNGADLMKFYSGDAAAANRPQLVIQYYVP